jgi:hypothetical protein
MSLRLVQTTACYWIPFCPSWITSCLHNPRDITLTFTRMPPPPARYMATYTYLATLQPPVRQAVTPKFLIQIRQLTGPEWVSQVSTSLQPWQSTRTNFVSVRHTKSPPRFGSHIKLSIHSGVQHVHISTTLSRCAQIIWMLQCDMWRPGWSQTTDRKYTAAQVLYADSNERQYEDWVRRNEVSGRHIASRRLLVFMRYWLRVLVVLSLSWPTLPESLKRNSVSRKNMRSSLLYGLLPTHLTSVCFWQNQ